LLISVLRCASTFTQEGTGEYVDDTVITGKVKSAMYEAAPKEIYSEAAKADMRVLFEVVVK